MVTTLVTFIGMFEEDTPSWTTTSRCAPVELVATNVASIYVSFPHWDALDAPLNLYASPLMAVVNFEDVRANAVALVAETTGTTGG